MQKVQSSKDILETEDVKDVQFNTDESYLEIQGTRYRYGSGFQAFSEGKPIDLQEIAATDEVTFRGVKGKAYSIVVTKGHGYIKPAKYKDFIGWNDDRFRGTDSAGDRKHAGARSGRNVRGFHEKWGL